MGNYVTVQEQEECTLLEVVYQTKKLFLCGGVNGNQYNELLRDLETNGEQAKARVSNRIKDLALAFVCKIH